MPSTSTTISKNDVAKAIAAATKPLTAHRLVWEDGVNAEAIHEACKQVTANMKSLEKLAAKFAAQPAPEKRVSAAFAMTVLALTGTGMSEEDAKAKAREIEQQTRETRKAEKATAPATEEEKPAAE